MLHPHQQTLPFHTGEADVEAAREAVLQVPIDDNMGQSTLQTMQESLP